MSAPSIAQAERAGAVLPLTPAQREVWIACQLGPMASCAYNWSLLLELEGLLRRDVLAECCRGVVARHEALRVGIEAGGERQVLAPPAHVAPRQPGSRAAARGDPGGRGRDRLRLRRDALLAAPRRDLRPDRPAHGARRRAGRRPRAEPRAPARRAARGALRQRGATRGRRPRPRPAVRRLARVDTGGGVRRERARRRAALRGGARARRRRGRAGRAARPRDARARASGAPPPPRRPDPPGDAAPPGP